ncbi:fimbrial protein [Pseudomonas sp. OST1909]|uniref:fimbrial protein n=1 Tax=Pseudomonas sp. OST1909 TaxID=2777367 RepID=UPI0018871DB0|nr:fimbrial protein [Pseudomonas sp. OST1909]QOY72414.1 type 1 fimbrial protein [Pseudomonas sp. OST1909]
MNYLSASTLMIILLAAPVIHASEGTVNFDGALVSRSCSSTVNGVAGIPNVKLPRLSVEALSTKGETAGRTELEIGWTCPGNAVLGSVLVYFEGGSRIDSQTNNIINAGGSATGVQLQLLDVEGKKIDIGSLNQTAGIRKLETRGPGVFLMQQYYVQYYANAKVTPGTVVGSVTYSMNYQ